MRDIFKNNPQSTLLITKTIGGVAASYCGARPLGIAAGVVAGKYLGVTLLENSISIKPNSKFNFLKSSAFALAGSLVGGTFLGPAGAVAGSVLCAPLVRQCYKKFTQFKAKAEKAAVERQAKAAVERQAKAAKAAKAAVERQAKAAVERQAKAAKAVEAAQAAQKTALKGAFKVDGVKDGNDVIPGASKLIDNANINTAKGLETLWNNLAHNWQGRYMQSEAWQSILTKISKTNDDDNTSISLTVPLLVSGSQTIKFSLGELRETRKNHSANSEALSFFKAINDRMNTGEVKSIEVLANAHYQSLNITKTETGFEAVLINSLGNQPFKSVQFENADALKAALSFVGQGGKSVVDFFNQSSALNKFYRRFNRKKDVTINTNPEGIPEGTIHLKQSSAVCSMASVMHSLQMQLASVSKANQD